MKIDNGAIIMEQADNWDANAGDSMAETSRARILYKTLKQKSGLDLGQFRSTTGYRRHPMIRKDWAEGDMVSDQMLPWALAVCPELRSEMLSRVKANGYRSGNGDLISPLLYAVLTEKMWLREWLLKAQALIFKLPYRWDDGRNKFSPTEESSCDHLNLIVASIGCSERIRRLIPKSVLLGKVCEYYAKEPNSDWIVDLYTRVLERYFYE